METRALLLWLCLVLAGCGGWPEAGGPTRGGGSGWPVLLPLDQVLAGEAQTEVAAASERESGRLAARAAALRGRAAILRGDPSDMEALRSRLGR